jgi:hypothetical protein
VNALDYYNNPILTAYIKSELRHITNNEDREDCQQEIFAELYDFMPLDENDAKRLIKRVCVKFERGIRKLVENEVGLDD